MVRTVMVDNFSTNGITMETIENIVSFCPTSPMMRHNQIAVANRRLNVAWRRMFRAVLRVLLPANISLSALSIDDLRDILGFADGSGPAVWWWRRRTIEDLPLCPHGCGIQA